MLEKEKIPVFAREETKIEQAAQGSLAEVVGVLLAVRGDPNFSQNYVEASLEVHGLENRRSIGIQSRQLHGGPRIPPNLF